MKLCPKCKAELDDSARFCLRCMTSLDDKEQIPPPAGKRPRWPLVLLCVLVVAALVIAIVIWSPKPQTETDTKPTTSTTSNTTTSDNSSSDDPAEEQEPVPEDVPTVSHTVDGVTYTYRSATKEDHPTAIRLDNYYVLIGVEGTPSNGTYYIPSFVGDDMSALVVAVAEGAFAGTNIQAIDLGYNVRYVWGNAFGGYALTDLHLHSDVYIDETAFSGCTESLTIHCPSYLENTEGELWPELAADYGFQWQDAII